MGTLLLRYAIVAFLLTGCSTQQVAVDATVFGVGIRVTTTPAPTPVPTILPLADVVEHEPLTATTPLPTASYKKPTLRVVSTVPGKARAEIVPPPRADAVMDQLQSATFAFVMPEQINVKDRARAQLLVDPSKIASELEQLLTANGQRSSGSIAVSKIVTVKLAAPDFEIETLSPERQAIAETAPTEWLWELTPKRTGSALPVELTVVAHVNVGRDKAERSIKTFSKVVHVDITPTQQAVAWGTQYGQWAWTTILLPIFGWAWKRYNKTVDVA